MRSRLFSADLIQQTSKFREIAALQRERLEIAWHCLGLIDSVARYRKKVENQPKGIVSFQG